MRKFRRGMGFPQQLNEENSSKRKRSVAAAFSSLQTLDTGLPLDVRFANIPLPPAGGLWCLETQI